MAMTKAEIEAFFPDESEERTVGWRDTEAIIFAEDDDLPPELQKKLFETDEEWSKRLAAAGIDREKLQSRSVEIVEKRGNTMLIRENGVTREIECLTDDDLHLSQMYKWADDLLRVLRKSSVTRKIVMNEEYWQWIVATPFCQLAEHADHVTNFFKATHEDIPWNRIKSLRDQITTDLAHVDWKEVTGFIFDDLPALTDQLMKKDKKVLEIKDE